MLVSDRIALTNTRLRVLEGQLVLQDRNCSRLLMSVANAKASLEAAEAAVNATQAM